MKQFGIDAMHFECDCELSNNTKNDKDDEIEESDEMIDDDAGQEMHTLSTGLSKQVLSPL